MPVAIAPVDWKAGPGTIQFVCEGRHQLAVLLVDGTLPAEVIIVLRNFEQTFAGHFASAQDVFEERNHVIRLLRSAKRENQNRIVILSCHPSTLSPAAAV